MGSASPSATAGVEAREAAFLRLASHHLDDAYRLARAIVGEAGDAQDATHDAIVQAWRGWQSLRDPMRFEAWFDRILINVCRNRLRQASRRRPTDISTEIVLAIADPFRMTHDREVIGEAIAQLTPDHRVVIALRYYRDLKVDEIAHQLRIPVGTVHSRLHYALRRLRKSIEASDRTGVLR
jgi:RNA polymerase sigma-70 factor, ECF subfamily